MKKFKFPTEITVASLEFPPFFEFPSGKNFDTKPRGSEGKLLQLLSEALNFTYKLITPPDHLWGSRSPNGTWSGLVGLVSKGEADMALCSLGITNERKEVVDFSEPYIFQERTFATNFPKVLPKIYTYTYPFDMKTWCGILIALLLVSFLLKWFKLAKFSYMFTLLSVLGNLCSRSTDEGEFERSVLLVSWWTFSFIVSSSYAAVLASVLALPVYDNSPKNLDELAEFLKQKRYRVVIVKDTSFLINMLKNQRENVVYIAETMEKNNWFVSMEKYIDESSFDDNTAVLGTGLFFNFKFGKAPLSTKFISDDITEVVKVGLIINKHFCCKEALDTAVTKIVRSGLYQQIVNFEIYKAWLRAANSSLKHDENFSFVIEDVLGPFIVLLFGYSLSVVVFLSEILLYHSYYKQFIRS
ncbi:probable glutamate receptor [Argiope bruennichi]|uniref:Glutamate receptor ionotropic like protein n=1 Tax=Argiope bruennichi TaxID=94029 RepID=A0A8T0EWI3_ARGBR|nr:probable glutamate receptor [Argiope bruennichi]KAF8782460.1 Glutamate receptor ionotropic like protein [Argiope bruennichi]